jgi:hypothetical protein
MKWPLAVAQETQAARAKPEERKSPGHVENHLGSRKLPVKSERSINISNVQGNTGERKVHSFYLSRLCNWHGLVAPTFM